MIIGVPRETVAGETRVASTPDIVAKLVAKGFDVVVEQGAGTAASFTDKAFEAAGATIADSAAALAADIVVKVRKPTLAEIDAMREGGVLIGFIEVCEDDGTIAALLKRGVVAIALERVPRISRAQSMDALSSQSNIAGYRAVIEAAAHYGRFLPLMMT